MRSHHGKPTGNPGKGRSGAFWRGILRSGLLLCLAAPAVSAQSSDEDSGLERYASEALATFGLVAIPNESASALAIKNTKNDGSSFRSVQFGGGRRLFDDRPLWIEGYLGFQRYDPQIIVTDGGRDLAVRAMWSGLAGTGGVGYDYRFAPNWSLRPIFNFSVGRIISDVEVTDSPLNPPGGPNFDFLGSGGLTVGGVGGSLLLNYEERTPERELDFSLRYTQMHLATIASSSNVDAKSDVATAAAWFRARYPVPGWKAFGRPVRSVWEASVSTYPGDQGKLLDIEWLSSVGAGLELATTDTGLPYLTRARLVARYVYGESYRGYSLGIGFSF